MKSTLFSWTLDRVFKDITLQIYHFFSFDLWCFILVRAYLINIEISQN